MKVMAKFLKYAIAMLVAILAISGCGKSLLIEEAPTPEHPVEKGPIGYVPVEANLIDVVFDDGSKVEAEYEFTLTAEATIKVAGTEPIAPAEELSKQAAEELVFAYNYGISNTVKANIVVDYVYNGKSYKLNCLEPELLTVSGTHSTKEEETTPAYYELSETVYTLEFSGIELASATQLFEVEEGYVPPTVVDVVLHPEHVAFRRVAEVDANVATVTCDNLAYVQLIMSDGTVRDGGKVSYVSVTMFQFVAPSFEFDNENIIGQSFDFEDEKAEIAGYEVRYNLIGSSIQGAVMYDGVDYASELTPCPIEAKNITLVSTSEAVVTLYHDDATDYAEARHQVNITIKGDEVDHIEWSTRHESFRREAAYADGVATVTCDNMFSAVQIMKSGSKQNAEEVPYNCQIKLNVVVSNSMEVEDLATAVGKDILFSGNVATIGNGSVTVSTASSEVVGEVMYQGKNYAGEITPCTVRPWSIRLLSATSAVVKVYNGDSSDYAEFVVPVNVTEKRKLISTDDSYSHVAFRRNAEVAGAVIAVTCDNEASFVDNYSDGTTENENVNYVVVNNFSYVVPTFVVNNIANLLGKSYNFNAGTAVVEGVNVSINFVRREVSAIMHNGKDYRSNAPACEVVPVSITITSATTATVRFEDVNNSSDYSEAVININTLEAEIVVGEIMGAWITDSYQGRTYVSTDLHILAKQADGSYVAYSRKIGETSFSTTALTAEEGNNLLSSGRAMAWAKPGILGSVSYVESDKSSTGYVIMYYYLNGSGANVLGDAEAALNGKPFTEPVKAVGAVAEGMWSISYNGTTYYFVSK